MGESKTLILIDGHALAFRQYYALERTGMKTSDGVPTWAVYGFFKAIFDLLKNKDLNADSIGVAFDVSHKTFRTEEYEEYKANREAMPDPMRIQMELIYNGLSAFSIPIYTKEGFEADDVIGTISKRACELGHKVLILTGDQDAFQLVDKDGCVKVIIPSKGELKEYNWNAVHEKLGVYPDQIIDYKALRGDTSDNIPGIKGIGEKTAVKLLEEFKTVDNVLANADKIQGNAIREKIKNGVEDAKLSKFLATIVRDVDINFDFDKTNIEIPEISKVTEFFRSMQFYSFLKNIENILKTFDKGGKFVQGNTQINQQESIQTTEANGQLGLFAQVVQAEVNKVELNCECKLITDTTDFEQMLNKVNSEDLISFMLQASVENAINSELYGISIGINKDYKFDNKLIINDQKSTTYAYYIPLNHNIENQLPTDYVTKQLKPIFEDNKIKKITHDLKNNINILKNCGINLSGVIFDTMLASYIKDSNAQTNFDIQCMERINHILATMVSDNKKIKFSDIDIEQVKNYSADATKSLFELTKFWVNTLDEKEHKILQDIEIPLSYVLSKMEQTGVSIDTQYLHKLTEEFDRQTVSLENKIYEIAGETFNINSPKQVGQILFEKLQLKSSKKGKAKNSTSAEVLQNLAQDNEIAQLILDYRKYAKLKSTYTEALPTLIDKKDNRIHTTYNQVQTTTGRLSSSNPNLQNIPIRTEEGNKIRQAFGAQDRENYLIISADYSQIELRLLAHVSKDENLINAFKSGIDVHTLTASKVFDVPVEKVTKDMRYKAKAVNFGIVYGQTKYGLAKALKISADEAQSFIDKYFETYPKIAIYMQAMIELVETQGYVETIFGRKRYLENEINSPNGMIREFAKRAAINHPMQGSASDLIKIAMVDFDKKLKENNLKSRMIMQVHDELVVETEKSELETVKKLVLEAMGLGQPLAVPLAIDINTGETWKES